MSEKTNHNSNEAAAPFVAELHEITGTFPPSAEQAERNKARKADLDFRLMKHRADAKERRRETLKKGARRNMRGEL